MSNIQQTTSSGRTVKRTGMNDSKKSALANLKQAREGGVKRTEQYEVSMIKSKRIDFCQTLIASESVLTLPPLFAFVQVAEQAGVFEELDQNEYDERQMARRDDDFIVDDEGFGYKDRGGEIWEVGESAAVDPAKKKKRKLAVS